MIHVIFCDKKIYSGSYH